MTKVTSSVLDRTFAEAPAVAQYDWVVTTQNTFDNAIADLRAATPGTEEYDTLPKTVRESFGCAKMLELSSLPQWQKIRLANKNASMSLILNQSKPSLWTMYQNTLRLVPKNFMV